MTAKEPRPASHFRLVLQGVEGAGLFRECSGLGAEVSTIETTTGTEQGQPVIRKVSGQKKYNNIVLKRGADTSRQVYQWWQKVEKEGPDSARCDGTIELMDYTGKVIHTYTFKQGFPVKWGGATINAQSNEMALEEVTIAHEGLTLV
jgi:phage tail-like protein